jgi:peptidoglycan/LPS O-acetylase OafA/YrhL
MPEPRTEPTAPPAGFRLGYRPALDGLRGLAVLAVMAHHSPLRDLAGGGFLGVDLFFVLSGFLITALLLEEHADTGSIHLGRFYLRRALRLLPALFLLLLFCCLLALGCRSPVRAWMIYRPVLLTACHAANWYWYFGVPLYLLGHAWSLSLEEQFYLAWPPVLAMLLRLRIDRRFLAALLLVGIVAAAVLRLALWQGPDTRGYHLTTTCLATRADAPLVGCLLAVCACSGWLPRGRAGRWILRALATVSAALLVYGFINLRQGDAFLYRGGFTLVATGAALCIAAVMHAPGQAMRLLIAPPLVWVGRVSYGLYLWHFPLFAVVPSWLRKLPPGWHPGSAALWAVQIALTFVIAGASFYLVEAPLRRWGLDRGRHSGEDRRSSA